MKDHLFLVETVVEELVLEETQDLLELLEQ
jgi:hypothetical protein